MTFPLLNAARHVCFLTKLAGKEKVIEEVLAGRENHPAGKVRPAAGQVSWLIGS